MNVLQEIQKLDDGEEVHFAEYVVKRKLSKTGNPCFWISAHGDHVLIVRSTVRAAMWINERYQRVVKSWK